MGLSAVNYAVTDEGNVSDLAFARQEFEGFMQLGGAQTVRHIVIRHCDISDFAALGAGMDFDPVKNLENVLSNVRTDAPISSELLMAAENASVRNQATQHNDIDAWASSLADDLSELGD